METCERYERWNDIASQQTAQSLNFLPPAHLTCSRLSGDLNLERGSKLRRTLTPGPEEFVNWTELNDLNGGSWPPCPELKRTNWQSARSGRRTELNELVLNDFELNLHHWYHNTSRKKKQAQPAKWTIPPPRRQTPGRRTSISAGGGLELFLSSSQTIGVLMDWSEPELSWNGRRHLVSTPRTELNELSGQISY